MNEVWLQLPKRTDAEDSIGAMRSWLRDNLDPADKGGQVTEFAFSIKAVLQSEISRFQAESGEDGQQRGPRVFRHDFLTNSEPYLEAVWELVRRGIAVPALTGRKDRPPVFSGTEFFLTRFGLEWVRLHPDQDVVPSEHSRFYAHLKKHGPRFGPLYLSRSEEALACYRNMHFIATCVLAGAAAEAIALELVIARSGDQEAALREYRTTTGVGKILRRLKHGKSRRLTDQLDAYFGLLKYWRDDAAHGAVDSEPFDEGIAFTAMLLLLRFAHFADANWEDLTTP